MKILTDLHTHTDATSHAYSTLIENVTHAAKTGIELIALTNHGPAVEDAPHRWHFRGLPNIPREIKGVTVIRGIEANVMDINGTLDIPADAKEGLDLVIAAVHDGAWQPRNADELVAMYEKLAFNDDVHMIGHLSRTEYTCCMEIIVPVLVKSGKVIEINNGCFTIFDRESTVDLIKTCKKHDAVISVNSDAHICYQIGNLGELVACIEEIGYPNELIINKTKQDVLDFLDIS